jgi:hypothetical protein
MQASDPNEVFFGFTFVQSRLDQELPCEQVQVGSVNPFAEFYPKRFLNAGLAEPVRAFRPAVGAGRASGSTSAVSMIGGIPPQAPRTPRPFTAADTPKI